jgi:hypothetical protein
VALIVIFLILIFLLRVAILFCNGMLCVALIYAGCWMGSPPLNLKLSNYRVSVMELAPIEIAFKKKKKKLFMTI